MTCKQLGGACDLEFRANTFDEIAEMSKNHGTEMFQKQDPDHMQAMLKMQVMMQDPDALYRWMNTKRQEFDSLPDS
jgi:predicted small metal-binding protein